MNLIFCSSDCIYQRDGECRLDKATSPGQPNHDGCAYYIRRSPEKKDPEGSGNL